MDTNTNETDGVENLNENIEVWEDLVSIKDLVLSLLICSVTALGGYFLAPMEPPMPLFFGLFGALLGFIVSSFIVKPKRILLEVESEE